MVFLPTFSGINILEDLCSSLLSLGLVLYEIFNGNLLPHWDQATMTVRVPGSCKVCRAELA